MQAEASSASVLAVTRPEDWSSCQDASGFELSVATADEFSRDGVLAQVEVGRDRDHGAPSDSSVSASGSGLGAA